MADLQVPPAVGTSGQRLDVAVINATSSIWRQIISIGDPNTSGNIQSVDTAGHALVVSASSGLVQLTSQITVTAVLSSIPSLTSGTVTLSSAIGISSGIVSPSSQWTVTVNVPTSVTVTPSTQFSVTATPSSQWTVTVNVPTSVVVTYTSTPIVQNASSGTVGITPSTGVTLSIFNFTASSSNSIQGVAAGAHTIYGWNFGSQATAQTAVRVYNTTAPTVGSTTSLLFAIPIPGTTGGLGAGNNYTFPEPGVNSTGGIGFVLVDNFATTSTGIGHNAGDVVGQLYYV